MTHVSRTVPGLMLGLLLSAPAFAAEGTDVSTDEIYSDDVTLTTFDGEKLDLNTDGNPDLAVASNLSGGGDRSRYYPGNGDGTFGTPVLLATGPSSEILAVDLNGDGLVDLVQGRRDQTTVFHLGDGAGGFTSTGDVSADTDRVLAVAAGDLDGDGHIDLVTATGHASGDPTNPEQPNRFYLNDGGATPAFTSAVIPEADEDDTRSIALADMDGDGKLDVIVGNDETTDGSNLIYLNQSAGDGDVSFEEGFDFGPPDDQTGKILIGDLDNDGDPDIVTLNFLSTGVVANPSPGINRFFLNESTVGTLAFVEDDVSAEANMSSGGALADFDGDGDLDIAVAELLGAGQGETIRNRLYLNQFIESGEVSFVGFDISADEHQSRELTAADIDGDEDIDIVVGNEAFALMSGRDRVYLNNGTQAPFAEDTPIFTSAPVIEASVGTAYTYDVTVTDPEGDAVTITAATELPAWLTLTDNGDGTATLTGTPAAGDLGDHAVSLQASDGTNSATQDFTIAVTETPAGNSPPEFTSTAVTAATEGAAYTYDITASDDDAGAALTITAPALPAWLALTDNGDGTARLTGTPAAGDVGDHDVSLEVSDENDATATQDFTITVEAASAPPPPPPSDGGGGGGGGSLGILSLLALFASGALDKRRRRLWHELRKQRCSRQQ